MRATIGDVAKHPKWLADWWLELPGRQAHWWKWLHPVDVAKRRTDWHGWVTWSEWMMVRPEGRWKAAR